MKTSKRYMVKAEKIHSMEDLRIEKLRLRLEIMKTEENIHSGYRNILEALSFKNIASTMVNDISASSSLLSQAFSFGKAIIAKRKKKKQDKLNEIADEPRP